ncbi:hypothetical protein [uncultured Nostoc sp.]|uniref:hypothetical protein n=1 Tax=uncultured Nostoc sp. TaxID=340711 RepID=UPI0026236641|nr:hypothetical protein [uncultured Nostoc sp.]
MTQRLDRIEVILERTAQSAEANTIAIEANAPAIDGNRVAIEANRVAIAQLPSTVNSLVQVVEIHQLNHQATQHNFEGIVTELREIRSEIRGLRTKSQPILEHLFGRQEDGES